MRLADDGTVVQAMASVLAESMELTEVTLPDFEKEAEFIHQELQEQGILKSVEVDAVQLDFIDSSGLGFLISLRRRHRTREYPCPSPTSPKSRRRTFEIACVDKVLLHA